MLHGWQHLKAEDRALILQGIEEGIALEGPFHAEIDPVDACNARCFFCNSAWFRENDVLRWNVLGPRVDELIGAGLRSVRLAGGGEPLLYPDLDRLSERLAAAGVVLENLTTNGIRLDEKQIRSLLPLGPTAFLVSLNYARAKTYERFMQVPGKRFEEAIEGIHRLHAALVSAGLRGGSEIRIQFFLHRSTVDELERMAEVALALPVEAIAIRSVAGLCEEERMSPEDTAKALRAFPRVAELCQGHKWLMFVLDDPALQSAGEVCIRHTQGEPFGASALREEIEYCYMGWYSLTIQGTGDVHPCCMLMPEKSVPAFGNIRTESIAQVWQGDHYRRFRKEMREVMLHRGQSLLKGRRFRCTAPGCWNSRSCAFSYNLADPEFYAQADARLARQRRKTAVATSRAFTAAARTVIDGVRSFAHGSPPQR
jgi:MoaA/NifB/PqqE/SkfB family radical SAM enzyme